MGRISTHRGQACAVNPSSGYFPAFMRSGLEIRPTGIRIKHLFNGFKIIP